MKMTDAGDASRIELLLAELRPPTVKQVWAALAAEADKEGWPAAHLLAMLLDHETAARGRRRIERHLAEARLPPGKTLDSFEFDAVPMLSKAQVMALAAGDAWLNNGANLFLFGPPGSGKSHLAAALGFEAAGGFCSPAPPTWCSGCRPPAATSPSKPPSPSSTSTTC
jgi:DNA replication protein DnaC